MGRIVNNILQGHPLAVDALYRAAGSESFLPGLFGGAAVFDQERGGVTLAAPVLPGFRRGRLRGVYVSPEVEADFSFQELLPSWNLRLNARRQGYVVYLRVADERGWSPWFYFGGGGTTARLRPADKVTRAPGWGKVKIDYLLLDRPADAFQYRVVLEGSARSAAHREIGPPVLQRFFVSYTSTAGDEELRTARDSRRPPLEPSGWTRVLPVPYRDQRNVPHRTVGHHICCPTCVAMVLDSHGISESTLTVAGHAYCPERRIYGVWPLAAQTASRYGLESWVQRFRTTEDVKRLIAAGVPVMASIRVKEGELANARYRKTAGHLILIRGFTPAGEFVVNDPYSPGPGGEEIVYSESDMAKVWFDKGGVGIVIRRPQAAEGGR